MVGHNNFGWHFSQTLTGFGHSLKGFGEFRIGFVTHGRSKWLSVIEVFWRRSPDLGGYGCFCATSGYATFHN
jgi:hypothetical protein